MASQNTDDYDWDRLTVLQWHALYKGLKLQVIFTTHNFMDFLSIESLLDSRLHSTHCPSITYSLVFILVKK